jgi:folate-binding protein YgfZ
MSLPGPHPRYEIVAPIAAVEKLWERLKSKATPIGPAVWAWMDIMAGIPSVHPGTNEEFVPQMANLEVVGGVNFKKGCTGPETARKYLGGQTAHAAHVAGERAASGTPLCSGFPGSPPAQPWRHNRRQRGYDLLAVIQRADAGEFHLGSETGPKLSLQPLLCLNAA